MFYNPARIRAKGWLLPENAAKAVTLFNGEEGGGEERETERDRQRERERAQHDRTAALVLSCTSYLGWTSM
jgi:hypothetical protein